MDVEKHTSNVIEFWFEETPKQNRFKKDPDLDSEIARRFGPVYETIAEDPSAWTSSASSCLAAIIVLDQFARNMFRGTPRSFAADPIAVDMAKRMIERDWIETLDAEQRNFALMPFMHSEDAAVHAWALPYFESYADAETLKYEHAHKEIIDRFGRYPHRNKVLGRTSTEEELEFLQEHSGF